MSSLHIKIYSSAVSGILCSYRWLYLALCFVFSSATWLGCHKDLWLIRNNLPLLCQLTKWDAFATSLGLKTVRKWKGLKKQNGCLRVVGDGSWEPGHIRDREPTSPVPCLLYVHIVWTDGRYSKTPQATEAISKRPVKPSAGGRKAWERRTKGCWKIFNFSITVATNQQNLRKYSWTLKTGWHLNSSLCTDLCTVG